jgi:hypothetical protein
MTTRCMDCHKKQGNVAAATTICYSTSAPLSVTWVEVSKPIVLPPMRHACGKRRTDDDNTCDVHMLPFLRQQPVEVHSCTCSNIHCEETVVATLEDAAAAGLLWFAGSLDPQNPLMLGMNSGKKQWFVSMPDVAHLNEVRMLTKCALKKWVEACYETAVHFGWSAAEMISKTISHLLMALLRWLRAVVGLLRAVVGLGDAVITAGAHPRRCRPGVSYRHAEDACRRQGRRTRRWEEQQDHHARHVHAYDHLRHDL